MSETNEVPTVGAQLARARQASGRDLSGISKELCIRVHQLQALETDDASSLPATPFAIGYVRSYARLLGLDADRLADQYRAQCGTTQVRTELNFPEPIHESRIPSRAVMATAAAALFGIYFGWFYGTADPVMTADEVSPVPDRLIAEAEQDHGADALAGTPAGGRPAAGSAGQARTETRTETRTDLAGGPGGESGAGAEIPGGMKAEALLALASAEDAIETDGDDQSQAGSGTVRDASAMTADASGPAGEAGENDEGLGSADADGTPATRDAFFQSVSLDLVTGANAAPVPDGPDGRVVLQAGTDTWILVTDADEDEVYRGVLRAGQQFTVPDLAGLRLMTSNAGGLTVYVDGEKLRPLGKRGAVLRGVVLEPDRLKRGGSVAMR